MYNPMRRRLWEDCTSTNFVGEQNEQTSSNIDWGKAVRISSWYGREHELVELEHWIVAERCRLIAVVGMGGMGKTALVLKLVQRAQEHFDGIIWLSLRNTPPLETLVTDCLHSFSSQKEYLPQRLEDKLTLLMRYLHTTRYLVVLDNLETVLQAGEAGRVGHYLAGYENYGPFLRQMGEAFHTSCFVITSREKPATLSLLEGKHSPVRSFSLSGLENHENQKLLPDEIAL